MAQILANPEAQDIPAVYTHARTVWEAPLPLRLWHLASLDAPTVAVVWALAFAWAAGVRLPAWAPVLLALVTGAVYVADRLLDAYAAIHSGATHLLRDRHIFHWRHRRSLVPLAAAAAVCAATIVTVRMPPGARERGSLLAAAALAYFAGVHSGRGFAAGARGMLGAIRGRWLSKELLVGILFTAGCALPALNRGAPWVPTLLPVVFFAALAWLNCAAIEAWESSVHAMNKAGWRSKLPTLSPEKSERMGHPALRFMRAVTGFASRDARHQQAGARVEVSHPSDKNKNVARVGHPALWFVETQTGPRRAISRAAVVLGAAGFLLALLLSTEQSREAALIAAAAASALLLALLDRLQPRLTPLALRAAADLVLLTPLALLWR